MSEPHVLALLRQQLSDATPNPETMSLLRSAWPELSPDERSALLEGLGRPTEEELSAWPDDHEVHTKLLRQWRWLVGISSDLPEPWATAYGQLVEQFGEGDADARDHYAVHVQVGSTSPIDSAEIARLGPENFAAWVQAWEPPPGRWMTPSPEGLAARLQEAVAEDPRPWVAALPDLVEALRHPTYIRGLLSGLRDAVSSADPSIEWSRLLQTFQLVVSEPWLVDVLTDDPFDADRDWKEAQREVMRLLQRAFEKDADLGYEDLQGAWRAILRLLEMRQDEPSNVGDDRDLVLLAINKDSTVALETMFQLALSTFRRGIGAADWGERLVAVVRSELDHGGREGVLAGAIVAQRFPQFILVGGDDALSLVPRLFGNTGRDEVRVDLLEVLFKYARPITNDLLMLFHPYLVSYFESVPSEDGDAERSSIRWLVIGYLRQLEHQQDAARLVELLHEASRISEAAEFYGRVLRDEAEATDEQLRAALNFWDEVLASDPPSEALGGFGWWSEGGAIPDSEWLPRIVQTIERAEGRVDWHDQVVQRLSGLVDRPAAWEGLAVLVLGVEERWTVAYWAGDLQKLLEASAGSEEPILSARSKLVEALIERELLDFRRYRDRPAP